MVCEFYLGKLRPCYTAAMISDCEGGLHPRAREGILLFNEGKYFESHEELEAAWKEERGKIRELYQGILQAAVTYLHITRGNYQGAVKVYGRSMKWLKNWPEHCRGVDVAQLRVDLDNVIAEVKRLGPECLSAFDLSLLKPIASDHGPACSCSSIILGNRCRRRPTCGEEACLHL